MRTALVITKFKWSTQNRAWICSCCNQLFRSYDGFYKLENLKVCARCFEE